MQRDFSRAVLASVLGLGVLAGLIRADPPPGEAPGAVGHPQVWQPMPAMEQPAETVCEGCCDGQAARGLLSRWPHPLRDWWQNHPPVGCWAHHNTLGCGSLRSEFNFIFGSCRTFYGEPCFKGPPPSPFPPGYGYAPTGCRCP